MLIKFRGAIREKQWNDFRSKVVFFLERTSSQMLVRDLLHALHVAVVFNAISTTQVWHCPFGFLTFFTSAIACRWHSLQFNWGSHKWTRSLYCTHVRYKISEKVLAENCGFEWRLLFALIFKFSYSFCISQRNYFGVKRFA